MLVLAELLNMPPFLSEKLLEYDSNEMFYRARSEYEDLKFNQFQEWIAHDLYKALQIEERKLTVGPCLDLTFKINNNLINVNDDCYDYKSMSGFDETEIASRAYMSNSSV